VMMVVLCAKLRAVWTIGCSAELKQGPEG